MSSDRTIYDKGAYLVKTEESNKPLIHQLDLVKHENCNVCEQSDGRKNVSNIGDRIDVESDLFGINRKLSRDPKEKFQFGDKTKSLNYVPAWLCERELKDEKFLDNNNENSKFLQSMKKVSPNVVRNTLSGFNPGDIGNNTV